MTGVSCLIVYIDLTVLEKMFEEYFLLKHYLDHNTYDGCYAPQAQMRMVFECFAIYCACLCTVLTATLAFNLSDDAIVWIAKKIVNYSFVIFGPFLFTVCIYGFFNIKALSKVCGLKGIVPHEINYVCIVLLCIFTLISLGISYWLASTKTMDMAAESFNDETSVLYTMTQMYFGY